MTPLAKPLARVTNGTLPARYGPDADRRIVVTLIPGNSAADPPIPDVIELRPIRTRRPERLTVLDAYRLALQARVNAANLERARNRKSAVAARRLARKIRATDRRLAAQGAQDTAAAGA